MTLAQMSDKGSSFSCFTAQAFLPAEVQESSGGGAAYLGPDGRGGDATALEWHQEVSTSLSKLSAQQFSGPVRAPCQPLVSAPLLKGCTLNIFMLSKITLFKNNFIDLVLREVSPGMFSLWCVPG